MSLPSDHKELALYIDQQVNDILSNGGSPTAVLIALSDHMSEIQSFIDSLSEAELDKYCQHYEGFDLFMGFLEDLYSVVENGDIIIPTYH